MRVRRRPNSEQSSSSDHNGYDSSNSFESNKTEASAKGNLPSSELRSQAEKAIAQRNQLIAQILSLGKEVGGNVSGIAHLEGISLEIISKKREISKTKKKKKWGGTRSLQEAKNGESCCLSEWQRESRQAKSKNTKETISTVPKDFACPRYASQFF